MKIIKGNLLDLAFAGQFELVAHGCNCQNLMGAGLARQVKERLPNAFIVDAEFYTEHINKIEMMGNFSKYWHSNGESQSVTFWFLNMYTQFHAGAPSPGSNIPFDYDAFTVICRKVNHMYKGKTIGLPWVGCGLGRADQINVAHIITKELHDMGVTIVEYENDKKPSGYLAETGLGNAISTGEGPYPSRRFHEDGGDMAAGDGGGEGGYKRGAPIKLSGHQSPTEHAAGRSYWIGDRS